MATMHSSPESCHDLLCLTGQKYLMLTFEINDFEMAEIKFGSKKCFLLFAKIFFLGRKKKGSMFQRNTLIKLQILEKAVALKKCHPPLSWGSFRQFNEYKS